MVSVLFVCLGNICRSPMSEFIFKDLVKKEKLQVKFKIESVATSYEEIGNDMHQEAKRKLQENGIPYEKRKARRLTKEDYNKFDYIIGMDSSNIRNILRIIEKNEKNKVCKLLDFTKNTRDIEDPWYTGNFTKAFNDIYDGCNALLEYIKVNNVI